VWEKKDVFLLPYSLGRRQVISLFPAKQETLVSRVFMTCNPHFSHRLLTAEHTDILPHASCICTRLHNFVIYIMTCSYFLIFY